MPFWQSTMSSSGRTGAAGPARRAGRADSAPPARDDLDAVDHLAARLAGVRARSATSPAAPAATQRRAISCTYGSAPPACGCWMSRQFSTTIRAPSRAVRTRRSERALDLEHLIAPAEVEDGPEAGQSVADGAQGGARRRRSRHGDLDDVPAVVADWARSSMSKAKPVVRQRAIADCTTSRPKNLKPHWVSARRARAGGTAGGTPRHRPAGRAAGAGDRRAGRVARPDGRGRAAVEGVHRRAGRSPAASRGRRR